MESATAAPARAERDDAGRYLRYMAEFIGFTDEDAEAVRRTKPIVAKHLPDIVAAFYNHLLRYPPTRSFFLRPDGSVDEPYLELRMRHQMNFWLRTADALLDDDYARYVDYVGRAHTARGADPQIYVAERYVIGMVGVVQNAISMALLRDLEGDEPLRTVAVEAWDKLLMVVLELLSRAYGNERTAETFEPLVAVDRGSVERLAARAHAAGRPADPSAPVREVRVAATDEIPEGERRIVTLPDGLSIGVFRHDGRWLAVRNFCLHRGGPVATGPLAGATITCPWHGFQYNLETGQCLSDPMAVLDRYQVTVRDGDVYVLVPEPAPTGAAPEDRSLEPDAFRTSDVPPGGRALVQVEGRNVLVFHVDGSYFATSAECPHAYGPLEDGPLEGGVLTCRLHGSRFDVATGAVVQGPAAEGLRTYRVEVEGDVGRVRPAP